MAVHPPAIGERLLNSRSTGTSPLSRACVVCSSQGSLNITRSWVVPAHLRVSSSIWALGA